MDALPQLTISHNLGDFDAHGVAVDVEDDPGLAVVKHVGHALLNGRVDHNINIIASPYNFRKTGNTRVISKGYRHNTRNMFSKKYRTKGEPGCSRYLVNFKRGDYVDVVVDSSIQKGMPYMFYHGKTGIVFNVNRNAVGVEITKIVGNRQLRNWKIRIVNRTDEKLKRIQRGLQAIYVFLYFFLFQ
jgi:ribosomal protein L21E